MTLNLNQLLEKSQSGENRAEETLLQHLRVRFLGFAVLRLGNGQDAEEAVQDALTTISQEYRSITFDVSFAAWAYKVLNNRILKKLNSRQRRESKLSKSDSMEHYPDQSDSAETAELRIKLADCLRKIGRVNKRYARILNLHYLGYATSEISDKLNISAENFYMILSRARSMLKLCLDTGTIK